MTTFWSLAAVMMMVSLLFVLPPLLRKRTLSAITRDDLNMEVIRAQLAELDTDLAAGKLDKDQFEAARKDLERELLYDLASPDAAVTPARSGQWAALLLVPAIPLCAVLLYQLLGSGELIDVLQRAKVSQPEPASTQPAPPRSLDEMAAQLAERMRNDPDNLQGWVMLVKTYNILRRPDDAVQAYENVLRLGGDNDPNVLADYADTLVMANGGVFTDEAGRLLLRALELQPDHVKALWLTGHWKNGQREYAAAISYWQQAAAKMPADGKDAEVIEQQIRQAQTRLGSDQATPAVNAQTPGAAAPEQSATGKSITVHVALDPQISTSAAPEDTVFIFARAAQGPRMPLAIVRKQVKDLPVTVTLDDSMAMSPQMVLSKFARVTIGARISKSGNAMPASGDLQGLVTPVSTQNSKLVQLTIDSKVP